MKPTYRLSVNSLDRLAAAVQAAVHVGRVLPIKPEQRDRTVADFSPPKTSETMKITLGFDVVGVPVQVVGGLVQECVILSDKLSPDQLGTWLLHHHFFGQLEIAARRRRNC